MAFTTTARSTVFGDLRVVTGTYTNTAGSTGGAITTGLGAIFYSSATSATATPSVVVVNSGGTATVTTTANQTGTFIIMGK